MTPAQFRKIALSFPEATESSHQGHPDFRVGGKIFATLGYPDSSCAVVMLDPDEQALFAKIDGLTYRPVPGAWGRTGSTIISLRTAKTAVVRSSVEAAWRRRAPKRLQIHG
jgi:hypothetical protein